MSKSSQPTPDVQFLKQITRQHGRQPLWSGVAVISGVFQTLFTVALAACLADVIHGLAMTQQSFSSMSSTWWWMLPCMVGRAASGWMREEAGLRISLAVRRSLRAELVERLKALGPAWAARQQAGALAATLLEQVESMDGYFARYRPQQSLAVVAPLVILVVVAPQSWGAALILLTTAPLIPVFMVLVGWGTRQRQTEQMQVLRRMSGHFLELIRGLPTLQLLGAQHRLGDQVAQVADAFRVRTMRVLRMAFLSGAVLEFFASIAIAVCAVYFGMTLLGHLNFGLYGNAPTLRVALFVLLLAPEFYLPLRELGAHYHARAEALAAAGELRWVLDASSPQPQGGVTPLEDRPPSLVLDQVSFAYPNGVTALRVCSLHVAPGEVVAIQGASGGGKTTVMRLLLGQIQAKQGVVRIGGIDIEALDLVSWRERVAWMGQHPRLLADTLASNLRVAAPEASDAQLMDALTVSGLQSWFASLPDGLQTKLGEGGRGLSGGQLRRLALARVSLRPGDVLLLDEPTASLDADTESALLECLVDLCKGRTVVLLTHRSAPLRLAHRVLKLHQGALHA